MGVCREFGPRIHPECEHPMRAGVDSCTCAVCGTRCTGQFAACPEVWLRSTAAVEVGAPATRSAPEVADMPPELPTATYAADSTPPMRRAPRPRRRIRSVAAAATVVTGALLVYAIVATGGGERADELAVTDRAPSTTELAPTTTPAPPTTPVPTTLAAPPSPPAPPPPSAAPPAPAAPAASRAPRTARAAPTPAPRPTTRPARGPAVRSFPRMCGFVPGSPVDVEINGKSAGTQTADGNGCVSRPPR
jgi:hypothetical protein